MALRAAAALASRGGAARSLCSPSGSRGVATAGWHRTSAAARLLGSSREPDHPDIPGRHPDIWPPTPHDSPDPDQPPGHPNPDLYPPDVGTPRDDPDMLPPRDPAPDIYPPAPDMPEPGSPRQGPWMALGAPGMCSPKVPVAGEVPLFLLRGPSHTTILAGRPGAAALLLKTDGGNSWLEAAAAQQSLALPSFCARRFHAGQEQPSRGNVPPEVPPRQPTEAPDQLPASSPPVSDDIGDVPDQTESGQRGVAPKVGPKASPGTPLDRPTDVPKPGFPGGATTQGATKLSEDVDVEH